MADSKIACAVISPDASLAARVKRLSESVEPPVQVVTEVTTSLAELDASIVDRIASTGTQLILLDLGRDASLGLRFARFVAERDPSLTFVLTGPSAEPSVLLEAMRVGASEFLPQPVEDVDLQAALARAARRLAGAAPREVQQAGHVYALYSPKGGTGVTTTATNLAVQLNRLTHRSTLLLDLDLELGNCATLLGIQPRYSVHDVVRNLHRMDQNLLASFVERHSSGIHVLASPVHLTPGETITKDQIRTVVHLLRRNYDYVILDLGKVMTPMTMAAIESADRILLITTPELPTLRNTKKVLPLLARALGSGSSRLEVVLNRHRPTSLIGAGDVQSVLDRSVFFTLSSEDEAIAMSVNEGKPLVLQPKSRYSREVKAMALALVAPASANGKKKKKRSILSALQRRKKEAGKTDPTGGRRS